ncbi:MAG: hypothetical protein II704_01935, partial [Erysipelotrichaceae bacterium]|nr:hypothetical protein [Erysipelotrichaceae bacterium]
MKNYFKVLFSILLCLMCCNFGFITPVKAEETGRERLTSDYVFYISLNLGRRNYGHSVHTTDQEKANVREALQNEHFRLALAAAVKKEYLLSDKDRYLIRNSITTPNRYHNSLGVSYTDIVEDKIFELGDWKSLSLLDEYEGFYDPQMCLSQLALAEADGIQFPVTLDLPYLASQDKLPDYEAFSNTVSANSEGRIRINPIPIEEKNEYYEATYFAEGTEKDGDLIMSGWGPDVNQPYGHLTMLENPSDFGLNEYGSNEETDAIWQNCRLSEALAALQQSRELGQAEDFDASYDKAAEAEALLIGKALLIPVYTRNEEETYAIKQEDGTLVFARSPYKYAPGEGTVEKTDGTVYGPGTIYAGFTDESFTSPWKGDSEIREVLIDGVAVSLGSFRELFADCVNLKSIRVENGGSLYAGQNADYTGMFSNCSSLQSLDLKDVIHLTANEGVVMTDMFAGCDSLTEVILGEDLAIWNEDGALPEGNWKNEALGLEKSAEELCAEYPANRSEWAGRWAREIPEPTGYAVATKDHELIFFNSFNEYGTGAEGTFTDVMGNEYVGKVYHTNKSYGSSEWHLEYDTTTVRVAEGQTVRADYLSFSSMTKLEHFYGKGLDT